MMSVHTFGIGWGNILHQIKILLAVPSRIHPPFYSAYNHPSWIISLDAKKNITIFLYLAKSIEPCRYISSAEGKLLQCTPFINEF
jgi:hypothetical protein